MLHYLYIDENEKHIMETAVFEKVCDLSREKLAKKGLDCILNLTASVASFSDETRIDLEHYRYRSLARSLYATLATSIGFFCATIYELICMVSAAKNTDMFSLAPSSMRGTKIPVGSIVKIGIPGALITIMLSVSNIVLNNYISIYGSDAVASYGIAYKIDMFPILLTVGFSQGVAPLMGYCFGAGQNTRLNRVMRNTIIDDVLFGFIFMVAFCSHRNF